MKSRGKLSDQDFYRIVACAAPPGGKCQKSIIKWSERDRKGLTIGFTKIDSSISERKKGAAMVALKNAVSQINGVGSGVRLVLIDAGKPDISVVLTAGTIMEVDRTPRTIKEFALSTGAAAIAQVDMPRGSNVIRAATVTISKRVKDRHLKSIMLEEVIQSLGLLTDIHNEYYHNRSIFSEVGSSVSRLRGQDAKALLYHYPRDG